MDTKHCTTCKNEKPLTEFHRNASESDGRNHICKACRRPKSAEHYQKNKSAILAKNAAWVEANREKKNARLAAWKRAKRAEVRSTPIPCRTCGVSFLRKKSWDCPACRRAKRLSGYREYYQDNRDNVLDWNRQYGARPEVKEHKQVYNAGYRIVNSENISAARKERYLLMCNDPIFRAKAAAARATQRAERGKTDAEHIQHLYAWQEGHCYYCSRVVPKGEREFDHIVPISWNGSAHPYNVVLACHDCNRSGQKHDHLVGLEWTPVCQNPGHHPFSTLDKQAPEGVRVLSSFWASERYALNAADVMSSVEGLVVFDDEWLRRKEAILNMAAAKGGALPSVQARKLKVSDVPFSAASAFLDRWHLQGSIHATVYLGLHNGGDLLGVASFTFRRRQWELSRLAFRGHVTGGFGKLLAYFRRHHQNGAPILSYVDPRHGNGNSYRLLGFEPQGETKTPAYFYATPTGIIHRLQGAKKAMQDADFFMDHLPEDMLNMINGRYRLFGRKQLRFLLKP